MASVADVDELVSRHMGILGLREPRPVVKLRDNLGSRWLGRCSWRPSREQTSTIEVQRSVLGDAGTLERVVAHEVVHHVEFMTMSETDLSIARLLASSGHGSRFHELAAVVNARMGAGFVTKESDQSYKKTAGGRKFLVLVVPALHAGRMGWAWAARVSPEALDYVRSKIAQGARLVATADERWARGARLKRYCGYSMPRPGTPDEELLADLYAHGERVSLP